MRTALAPAIAKIVCSLLIALGCGRGLKRRLRNNWLFDRLRRRTRRAASDESRQPCRRFVRGRAVIESGLRLVAEIPRRLVTARLPLVVRAAVLVVAIVELAVRPRAAILLLRARLIPLLPLGIWLRTAAVRSWLGLWPLLWTIERRLRRSLLRGGEPVRHSAEIVVVVSLVGILRLVRRTSKAGLSLLLRQLRGSDQPEIVFCVLEIAFGHHRITGGVGVTRKLKILLSNVVRCSPDFYVRPV